MLHSTSARPTLFFFLLAACSSPPVQAQAPGLMGADTPTPSRMPLLMPDDFSEMNLVAWRVAVHLATGCGGIQRKGPTGGLA